MNIEDEYTNVKRKCNQKSLANWCLNKAIRESSSCTTKAEMLHHYNYSTSLSQFLNYHQLEEHQSGEAEQSVPGMCEDLKQRMEQCKGATAAGKSFTIAAILGLQAESEAKAAADLGVVNLSVHAGSGNSSLMSNCGRLQLPVRHSHGVPGVAGSPFSVSCNTSRHTVRGLKHMSTEMPSKKNCKSKRVRTIFTPEQLERLEAEFERQQYMVGPERLYLAHTLQLTEAQVKVWFQNRRIKWRKHHLELTHQRLAALKQQQLLLDDSHPDIQDTNSSSTDT